jgi:hypothetical protein
MSNLFGPKVGLPPSRPMASGHGEQGYYKPLGPGTWQTSDGIVTAPKRPDGRPCEIFVSYPAKTVNQIKYRLGQQRKDRTLAAGSDVFVLMLPSCLFHITLTEQLGLVIGDVVMSNATFGVDFTW